MKSCVLLVCNAGYASYATALARQIRRTEPDGQFDIVLASPDTNTLQMPEDGPLLLPIQVDSFITALPANSRLKHYTYWRLPAIEKACQIYDRVLYLDVDIYCAAPGIDALMSIDMKGKPLAAVLDVQQQYRARRIREFSGKTPETAPYFNAGVLLIDAHLWRAEAAFQSIKALCDTDADRLYCHDQSLLNLCFFRNWLELSPVWNWQFSKKNSFIAMQAGPRLIHYAGSQKIWDQDADSLPYSHWLSFNPDRTLEKRERNWDQKAAINRQFFVSGLYYRRKTLSYLRRFTHDMATIAHT